MSPRTIETTLAYVTLAFLAVFAPLETVVSWPYGLTSPYYLVDAIAIVVMGTGAVRSLRARPASAPSVLTVGWAWAGANFWRASLARSETIASGGKLSFGSIEMTLAIVTTALAMSFVALGIWLIMKRGDA
jgi:branched-subunit amino acid ABC-type transport system permease component